MARSAQTAKIATAGSKYRNPAIVFARMLAAAHCYSELSSAVSN